MKFMHQYRRCVSVFVLAGLLLSTVPSPVSAEYDPKLGRWLRPDPHGTGLVVTSGLRFHGSNPAVSVSMAYQLQYADGMNFYQFVGSNPINHRDPSGLTGYISTLYTAANQAMIGTYLYAAAHPAAMQLVGGIIAGANLYAFAVYDEARAIVIAQPNPGGLIAGELAAVRLAIRDVLRFAGGIRSLWNATAATRATSATATAVIEGMYASEAGAAEALISRARWPTYAARVETAQSNGYPTILTIDRAGAEARRAAALKGVPKVPGMDLDEYPPAMFKEGGLGASVTPLSISENRAAGASIARQLENFPDGTKVIIRVVE